MAKHTKNSFDFIVIGDDWVGLSLAHTLAKNNKVALVKSFHGNSLYQTSDQYSGEFEFIPNKNKSLEKVQWFSQKHKLNLEFSCKKTSPQTIESGKLVQFLGFGDRVGKSIEPLSWYNESEYLTCSKTQVELKKELYSNFEGKIFETSEVTSLNIVDKLIESVTLNGQKNISAKTVIYCEPPNKLLKIIDHGLLPGKFKQKITKIKPLSCLQIIYKHKNQFEHKDDLHFLMGKQQDFEPCIGYFWTKNEEFFSQWMTLMPSDLTEDIEKVGSSLKNIKRQIKRAYPDFSNTVEFEKVIMKDQTHGFIDLELKEPGKIKGINNLICASSLFSKENDFISAIDLAQNLETHPDLVSQPEPTLE